MKIGILGAGAYGLSLALLFHRNHNSVTVWTKIENEKREITETRYHSKALPGIYIPERIKVTTSFEDISECDLIVIAVPISFFRSTCLELKRYVNKDMNFCIATKGIENKTGYFCDEIFHSIIESSNLAILSGPTFAIDLVVDSYSGLTLATNSDDTYEMISNCMQNDCLKIERSYDIIGVEICGAIKNIMAIISGFLEGSCSNETTKALFFTKAVSEISSLITAFGGDKQTMMTLAGIGDLFLTCSSSKSRNFSLGILLATDQSKVLDYINTTTTEGYHTLISIYPMIKKKKITVPFIEALYSVLLENNDKKELLEAFSK